MDADYIASLDNGQSSTSRSARSPFGERLSLSQARTVDGAAPVARAMSASDGLLAIAHELSKLRFATRLTWTTSRISAFIGRSSQSEIPSNAAARTNAGSDRVTTPDSVACERIGLGSQIAQHSHSPLSRLA